MMLSQLTHEKLHKLKLNGFIDVFKEIMTNPSSSSLSLDESLHLMADRELLQRENRRQERLLKAAKLRYPQASMEAVNYQLPRQFNQQLFRSLSNCKWVLEARNVIFIGPTGVGKSHLACALGNQACRQLLSVSYYRVSRLVEELRISHADGSYSKLLDQLAKRQLLILDDWGIDQLDRQARRDLLEVLEDRSGRTATVITTQLPINYWHEYIGDGTIADAICDRVINKAYEFTIEGESMRKSKNNNLTDVDQSV